MYVTTNMQSSPTFSPDFNDPVQEFELLGMYILTWRKPQVWFLAVHVILEVKFCAMLDISAQDYKHNHISFLHGITHNFTPDCDVM